MTVSRELPFYLVFIIPKLLLCFHIKYILISKLKTMSYTQFCKLFQFYDAQDVLCPAGTTLFKLKYIYIHLFIWLFQLLLQHAGSLAVDCLRGSSSVTRVEPRPPALRSWSLFFYLVDNCFTTVSFGFCCTTKQLKHGRIYIYISSSLASSTPRSLES